MTTISWFKLGFDLLSMGLLFTSMLLLIYVGKPVQSGFFCNDFSVNQKFKENTVSSLHLVLISSVTPVVLLLLTELVRFVLIKLNDKSSTEYKRIDYRLNFCCLKVKNVIEPVGNLYTNLGEKLFNKQFI